jgi:hypothetical protein
VSSLEIRRRGEEEEGEERRGESHQTTKDIKTFVEGEEEK